MRRGHKYRRVQRHIERKRSSSNIRNIVTYSKADFLSFEFKFEILVDRIFRKLQINARIHRLSICTGHTDKAATTLYEVSDVKLLEISVCGFCDFPFILIDCIACHVRRIGCLAGKVKIPRIQVTDQGPVVAQVQNLRLDHQIRIKYVRYLCIFEFQFTIAFGIENYLFEACITLFPVAVFIRPLNISALDDPNHRLSGRGQIDERITIFIRDCSAAVPPHRRITDRISRFVNGSNTVFSRWYRNFCFFRNCFSIPCFQRIPVPCARRCIVCAAVRPAVCPQYIVNRKVAITVRKCRWFYPCAIPHKADFFHTSAIRKGSSFNTCNTNRNCDICKCFAFIKCMISDIR